MSGSRRVMAFYIPGTWIWADILWESTAASTLTIPRTRRLSLAVVLRRVYDG